MKKNMLLFYELIQRYNKLKTAHTKINVWSNLVNTNHSNRTKSPLISTQVGTQVGLSLTRVSREKDR